MAGLIREEDIALVRERARIDEVVSSYVTLRNAGGGSQKGLCPFHDEKSPSFHVTPVPRLLPLLRLLGGRRRHLLPAEDRRRSASPRPSSGWPTSTASSSATPRATPPGRRSARATCARGCSRRTRRPRTTTSSSSPPPRRWPAGTFLSERGFDRDAADTFGVGFAPRTGDALYKHLRQKGFKDEELVTGGLVAKGRSGHYDRFRGRLLWPIRETNGDVIGFGARRLFDDDRIDAKYLNTPETPIYKKSHVLYGIDLARRDIARSSQAVVVEGYTDVMACHLAGVTTAVATCGTAFGEDHGRVVRRLLNDHEEFRGEVIFTFDGDEAGQRAALRAFGGDQQFVAQTYVAVEPDGLDPCDLRLQKGDAAVRELVARRIPLYRFVLKNVVSQYDLDRADARAAAVREAATLVSSSRDTAVKNNSFAREIAKLTGVDPDDVVVEVRRAAGRAERQDDRRPPLQQGAAQRGPQGQQPAPQRPAAPPLPDLRDPRFSLERETLKLVVQHPQAVGRTARDVDGDDFTHPTYRAVWEAVIACGGPAGAPGGEVWVSKLRDALEDEAAVRALSALAVEPVLSAEGARPRLRRRPRLPAPGADRAAPDRRPEVQAAAHQPGGAGDRLQPDVRRAGRARAAPPHPPREGDRRHRVRLPFRRGSEAPRVPADVTARAGRHRVLAAAQAADGTWLLGTRGALVLVPAGRAGRDPALGARRARRVGPRRRAAAGLRGRGVRRPAAGPRLRGARPGAAADLRPRACDGQRGPAAQGGRRGPAGPVRARPALADRGRRDRVRLRVRRRRRPRRPAGPRPRRGRPARRRGGARAGLSARPVERPSRFSTRRDCC